jgi:hypothetical protein
MRHIEVKSSRGEPSQVVFTGNEWRKAQELGDEYYLYVVHGVKPEPDDDFVDHITEYQNPYEQFQDAAEVRERAEYVLQL